MTDDDLRAALSASDPARALPPLDPDAVARLLDDAETADEMADEMADGPMAPTREARFRPAGNRLTWLIAAAAVVVIAAAGLTVVFRSGGDSPTTAPPIVSSPAATSTSLTLPAAAPGKCIPPTVTNLAARTLAFQGTVTSVQDGVATFTPSRFYAGTPVDTVRVTAPSAAVAGLGDGVRLVVGHDYLISALEGQVTVCGFSGPVTTALQSLYAQAFPS